MHLGTQLFLQVLWILLLAALAVAVNYLRWMRRAKWAEASREQPAKAPTTGAIMFLIVVIISACLAAFLYFRATFPH